MRAPRLPLATTPASSGRVSPATETWTPAGPVAVHLDGNGHRNGADPPETHTHRILLLVSTLALFAPALIAWVSIVQLPGLGALAACGFAVAVALAVTAVICKGDRALARLDWAVLLAALAILVTWAATQLYYNPAYGTDEAAFVQAAAQKTLHGHNPYRADLLPSLTQFRVPIQFATYKLNGAIASHLAYPSLSFLIVIPAVLLTHGVQAVIAENVLFLGIEMILMFLFLPRTYRALSVVVVVGIPFLFDYTLGGGIITLWVPFMLVVAYRWSDIGSKGRLGAGGWTRAICLGLAASIGQLPWFIAPFLLLGLLHLRARELGRQRAAAVVGRFLGLAFTTTLLINAPFIVWAPRAWFRDVLSPLLQHAVPLGQGLIDLTMFFHVGGGNLAYYNYAALACLVALLAAYSAYFDRLWRTAFMLPSVAFLFSTRSLSGYVVLLVGIWIVSVLAPGRGPSERRRAPMLYGAISRLTVRGVFERPRTSAIVLALSVAAGLACIVLALTTAPPLTIHIKSVQTNGQFQSIWRIRALVANRSHAEVRPHFATDTSGYLTTFWNVVDGPATLKARQSAVYTLVAPNVGSMPGVTQSLVLQAFTTSPDTVSSSGHFTPEPFRTYISPSYVDEVLPLGRRVTLRVELQSPYGGSIHRGGVPIALGQVIYGQNALIVGEASINGAPQGQTPVVARTDERGIATFHIRQNWVQGGNPLYFEAWVDPPQGFPYGYSEVVSVQWRSHS